ncbi:MAG: type II toxin-antitoxin system RelE/ParE family toxin [Salinivirgaceae bacterium]|nr:type II toxin-antitoxin system RelE/ParE family toxin [Salinivirgaceae bacterium]
MKTDLTKLSKENMKIVYKETFVQRLERQLQYIANDNPSAAKRFKKNLIQNIKKIPNNPQIYRKSIYFDDNSIRDLIFKGYTIVFRINQNQIEVFGFVKFQENPTD